MTDFGHTSYAEQARTEKAVRLETQLAGDGILSDAVRSWDGTRWVCTLPERTRRRLEKAAGVRRASDETWLRAAELLAHYEQTRKRIKEQG